MNAKNPRTRSMRVAPGDPTDYLARRVIGLTVVGAALLGTLAAAASEAVGLPHEVAMAVGVGTIRSGRGTLGSTLTDVRTRWASRRTRATEQYED